MGYSLSLEKFDKVLEKVKTEYRLFAPVLFKGKGTFSDTDIVGYGEVKGVGDIVFDRKSDYSPKEVLAPITQTLFYFTEKHTIVPEIDEKGIIIFLRACDIHAFKRFDDIYLRNGEEDFYYKRLREKVKFALIGCSESFRNCFCVSMGTNTTEDYDLFISPGGGRVNVELKDTSLEQYFEAEEKAEVKPEFVKENEINVKIPEDLDNRVFNASMWKEYSKRCIACGRCVFVCGTCTCFSTQDIFYKDNPKSGERRRVWAACHVDGFTDMAGGHSFRHDKGDRMRYKVLHKISDHKKRFGYLMCVGCGRCDDICPEYISFSNCVNRLESAMEEVKK